MSREHGERAEVRVQTPSGAWILGKWSAGEPRAVEIDMREIARLLDAEAEAEAAADAALRGSIAIKLPAGTPTASHH